MKPDKLAQLQFFDKVERPFFLEHYYDKFKDWMPKTVFIDITSAERTAMINTIWGEAKPKDVVNIGKLEEKVKKVMTQDFKNKPVFVRLGSRSPKDSYYLNTEMNGRHKITNVNQAMRVLLDSERIYDDLNAQQYFHYKSCLAVREYYSIDKEFRCIVKDNKLVGISQYVFEGEPYKKPFHYRWDDINIIHHFMIAEHIVRFELLERIPANAPPLTIDIATTTRCPIMLEINPFLNIPLMSTDPCLFNHKEDKFEKLEFRFVDKNGVIKHYVRDPIENLNARTLVRQIKQVKPKKGEIPKWLIV